MNPNPCQDDDCNDYLELRDYLLGGIFIAADKLGWDSQVLSDHSGVSRHTITNYRNSLTSYPHIHTLYRLACAVGLDLELTTRQP